jgi:Holliday junction resolvase-like predicted endonuclease
MDARTAGEMDEETLLNHAMNHLSKKGYFCRREVRTPLQKIDMVATRGDETLVVEAESSSEANRVKQGFRQLANVKPYMGLSAR